MKTVLSVLVAVVALSVATANAEEGAISRNALAKMGFGNMKKMSDSQGMKVRGKWAWGFSGSFSATTIPGSLNGTAAFFTGGGATNAGATSGAAASANFAQTNFGPLNIPLGGVAIQANAITSGGGTAYGY